MKLSKFVPSTCLVSKQNKTVPGFWPIGIDYGFSSVKGFAPNKYFSFPNCAVRLKNDTYNILGEPAPTDIAIRDSDGLWIIGQQALSLMDSENANNYEMEMYGRNRYFSPVFGALMKTGLAFGIVGNSASSWDASAEKIYVQTGLPPKYRKGDSGYMKEALTGDYDFEIKVGAGDFQRIRFSLAPDRIFIMDQPKGALMSSVTGVNGNISSSQSSILRDNTLIMDPGFKTLDIYNISGGLLQGTPQTYDNLGMLEVYQRAADSILKKYHKDMSVPEMQVAMMKGYFNAFDHRKLQSYRVGFDSIVETACEAVCSEAVSKILTNYNFLRDHQNLVITGGTGDAWFSSIKTKLNGMSSLSIVSANRNDPEVSNVFSNVRGYYFYLVNYLSRA